MKNKKIITVNSIKSNSEYQPLSITLCGKWLNEYGFSVGDKLIAEISNQRITISKINFFNESELQ